MARPGFGQTYISTDLTPTSGFTSAEAWGTTGAKQAGYGRFGGGATHALLWSGTAASAVDLHPTQLGGFVTSQAFGAGGEQQIGLGSGPGISGHALLWTGSANSVVDLHPAGYAASSAWATTGSVQVGVGDQHALLWRNTANSVVDLHPTALPGWVASEARAASGERQVGFARGSGSFPVTHAIMWSGTAASAVDLNPNHLAGITHSMALGAAGDQVVGEGWASGTADHALLWSGTAASAVDLHPTNLEGITNSIAHGTNGTQQVGGGWGFRDGFFDTRPHALLWSGSADSAVDLHEFLPGGFVESFAHGIDSAGRIVGYAKDDAGGYHAIQWQPVPEPCGALLLLGLAGATVSGRSARRSPAAAVAVLN